MARSDWRISEIIISEIMLINEWICEEQRRTGAYYFYIIFLAFPVFRAVGSTLQEQDMPVSVYFTQLILGVSAEEQFFYYTA
ncbi:MAG: hypothetical protein IJV58_06390 [Oscillospiraceae bacterium]|nr:hypothetical protein [Oscillospiraceae bacterium]MBR1458963.1 hypothetical protein [Oscillospiraceae bacterium]